jgi:hypothetical protein
VTKNVYIHPWPEKDPFPLDTIFQAVHIFLMV